MQRNLTPCLAAHETITNTWYSPTACCLRRLDWLRLDDNRLNCGGVSDELSILEDCDKREAFSAVSTACLVKYRWRRYRKSWYWLSVNVCELCLHTISYDAAWHADLQAGQNKNHAYAWHADVLLLSHFRWHSKRVRQYIDKLKVNSNVNCCVHSSRWLTLHHRLCKDQWNTS